MISWKKSNLCNPFRTLTNAFVGSPILYRQKRDLSSLRKYVKDFTHNNVKNYFEMVIQIVKKQYEQIQEMEKKQKKLKIESNKCKICNRSPCSNIFHKQQIAKNK